MKQKICTAILSGLGMLMLILDSKTALNGAADGVKLCLQVAVPSLLPFFVLSMMLTSCLTGTSAALARPLGRLCGIPQGAESLLLVGLLGGYPVGAQNISAAWRDGQLTKETARRMLGFCSNAGPAFIFGIVAAKFEVWWIPWALWLIHILSALLTGMVLPGKQESHAKIRSSQPISLSTALKRSISVMATVCGWIVLFRLVIAFLDLWFLRMLPPAGQAAVMGILELANGCCELELISNTGLRFIAAAGMLSFGGLCVTMQTVSATDGLGLGAYLPGKLLQTIISLILAFAVQLSFTDGQRIGIPGAVAAVLPVLLALFAILLRESEKNSSNPQRIRV